MNKPTPEKKRVALGNPLPRPSEAQSEANTLPTKEEIANAAAWWRENAEKGYGGLLDALEEKA